ncbi:hypothetical protein GCM10009748_10370 [Agromyces lapidis]
MAVLRQDKAVGIAGRAGAQRLILQNACESVCVPREPGAQPTLRAQRKPMCVVAVSSACGERADGR